MPTFEPQTKQLVTGVIIKLSNDDASHLSYALKRAKSEYHDGRVLRKTWTWLDRFLTDLDKTRGRA